MEGPVQLPKRPTPELQLSTPREKTNGTIEPEGPEPIRTDEVIPPRRLWASIDEKNLRHAIDAAMVPLNDLFPPCPSIVEATASLARMWWFRGDSTRDYSELWVLVHKPGLLLQLPKLGRALARALFKDNEALFITDCREPQNGKDHLFGAPPGYRGCLEGGVITNHLKKRPESVIVLSNFEYADDGTLKTIHNFARNGACTLLVARGCEVSNISGRNAVFVLSTTRASAISEDPVSGLGARLGASLREARPDLDWEYFYTIRSAEHCYWG